MTPERWRQNRGSVPWRAGTGIQRAYGVSGSRMRRRRAAETRGRVADRAGTQGRRIHERPRRWPSRVGRVGAPERHTGRAAARAPIRFAPSLALAVWAKCIERTTRRSDARSRSRYCRLNSLLMRSGCARFEREARMLATLNHPHIGEIYGVQEAGGVRALVLELVEGETLADRIARTSGSAPMPVPEALGLARQISGGARGRPRKGHRPPGLEASEHQDHARWSGQGSGLRPGESACRRWLPPRCHRNARGAILGTAAYMSPSMRAVVAS